MHLALAAVFGALTLFILAWPLRPQRYSRVGYSPRQRRTLSRRLEYAYYTPQAGGTLLIAIAFWRIPIAVETTVFVIGVALLLIPGFAFRYREYGPK